MHNLARVRREFKNPKIKTYGTFRCGLETMGPAWESLEHAFSVGPTGGTKAKHSFGTRPPADLLTRCPVDMLVVDRGGAPQASPGRV